MNIDLQSTVFVPSPCGMLSHDQSLRPDTWNLVGTSGNVFGNPCAVIDSSSTPYQGRHHSGTHYDQVQGNLLQKVKMFSQTLFIAVKTFVVCRSEEQNRHTIPTPSFPRTPSTMNSFFQQKEHIHRITLLINKDFSSLPYTLKVFILEDKIRNSSKCFFPFSFGGNVMDQRSGDGRFGGRFSNHRAQFKVIPISRILRCWMRRLRPL